MTLSPRLRVPPSPSHPFPASPVSPSPRHRVSPSPRLPVTCLHVSPSPRLPVILSSHPALGHRRHPDSFRTNRRLQGLHDPNARRSVWYVRTPRRDAGLWHDGSANRSRSPPRRGVHSTTRTRANRPPARTLHGGDETRHGKWSRVFQLLPGVRETLEAIAAHPRYRSALLTGNIEPAAYLKMDLMELSPFFDLPGAFGDESHDRRDLPAFAAKRIQEHLGVDLEPHQFIVIGDTPNDIDCARHFGARALAVGTGRLYRTRDLLDCKPDAFIPNLSDPDLVLQTLAKL